MMQDSSRTTSYIYDGDTSVKLSLWGGDYYWEFINDPTASIPAVLVSKGHTDLETTYVYYVREPGGELLASFDLADPQVKRYYHFDALGSTVLVTNGGGTVSDSFTYGAWGAVLNTPQNNLKPYQYVGQLGYYQHSSDRGTAMHDLLQLGVRFYDRDTGRFTQRDPIKTEGQTDYAYANSNAIVRADPDGRFSSAWCALFCIVFWEIYDKCEELCAAANDINELRKILNKAIGDRGQCHNPKITADCVERCHTKSRCAQCCSDLYDPVSDTQQHEKCMQACERMGEKMPKPRCGILETVRSSD